MDGSSQTVAITPTTITLKSRGRGTTQYPFSIGLRGSPPQPLPTPPSYSYSYSSTHRVSEDIFAQRLVGLIHGTLSQNWGRLKRSWERQFCHALRKPWLDERAI